MKKLALLSLLVLACASPTQPDPTPSTPIEIPRLGPDGPEHSLPHAQPCHDTTPATETQGQGGYLGQCVALN